MKRLSFFLLAFAWGLAMCAFFPPAASAAQDSASADEAQRHKLVTFFWGIVGYARWQETTGPLRVCLTEDDRNSSMIRQSAKGIELGRPIVIRSRPENAEDLCDVIYVSRMSLEEMTPFVRTFAGTSVLTIGEGGEFCSAGGMFCLLSGGKDGDKVIDRFAVNLDAISRSTLRINPQVLRLAKPKPKQN